MKKFFITLGLMSTITAYAVTPNLVTLDLTLSMNGKLVSQPQVKTAFGQTATVTSKSNTGNETFLEITPVLQPDNLISMKLKTGEVISGKKISMSEANVLTRIGEKAQISTQGNNNKNLSITVTPTL